MIVVTASLGLVVSLKQDTNLWKQGVKLAVAVADLSKLKMLDAIAKEALRLHATAPIGSVRQV